MLLKSTEMDTDTPDVHFNTRFQDWCKKLENTRFSTAVENDLQIRGVLQECLEPGQVNCIMKNLLGN